MEHPYLSAVIIAFNEERNIARCLDSLVDIADEVVVVDSGSIDKTRSLCEERGARVVFHPFEGHVEQKNWAWTQTKGSWILSLDADECLSEELISSLRTWKADRDPEHLAYGFNRLTSYCGQWVRHSGWYPDRKLRLWKRDAAAWDGQNPHDRLALLQPGMTGWLSGDLLHYSYYLPEDHYRQIAYFSDIAAQTYSGGAWASWPVIRLLKAAFQWFKTGVLKGGWKDGRTGWTIARMSAFATLEKYRKVYRVLRSRRLLKKREKTEVQRVLIARTDAIGDLVLTVPLAGWLKQIAPDIHVTFLVRSYAAPVAQCAVAIDNVLIWNPDQPPSLAGFDAAILAYPDPEVTRAVHRAGIPIRIGTGRRRGTFLFLTHRVWQSRKHSGRHETWHGLQLLYRLHLTSGWFKPGLIVPESAQAWSEMTLFRPPVWKDEQRNISGAADWLKPSMKCVIFHPGSRGSANNWSLDRYGEAALSFLEKGCRVILTGTKQEGGTMASLRSIEHPHFVDTIGQLDLKQLMALIQDADGLLASSTGPLHLAAALNTPCVGLFGKKAPAWPERWHPVGLNARWLAGETDAATNSLDIPSEAVWEELNSLWSSVSKPK